MISYPLRPTTAETFAREALYEFKIDTNGDAVADIAYRVRFSPSKGGAQIATLRRVEGALAAGTGDDGDAIFEGAPVSSGRGARVTESGEYRFFAGWRSDRFFFDRRGAVNNLQFTGEDFFADKNVCSIVPELPNSALGPKAVCLWHRTLVRADGGSPGWVQVERGARPLQLFLVLGLTDGERCLPRRRAGGRWTFRRRFGTRAGTHRWLHAGRSKARGRDNAARDPTL